MGPIIIWRPSARVQIADDLPPELIAELLGEPLPGTKDSTGSKKDSGSASMPSSPRSPRSSRSPRYPRGHINAWNSSRGSGKPSFLKKDYGAWYLKPKEWNASMTGELKSAYEKSQQAKISGTNSEVD